MSASFGGTKIYTPLYDVVYNVEAPCHVKRVFLLTDGEVYDREEVISLAGENCDVTRIHTFGIGESCDSNLIEGVA